MQLWSCHAVSVAARQPMQGEGWRQRIHARGSPYSSRRARRAESDAPFSAQRPGRSFRQPPQLRLRVAVEDNTLSSVRKIKFGIIALERIKRRLNRLRDQRARPRTQNLGRRLDDFFGLTGRDDASPVHSVSLLSEDRVARAPTPIRRLPRGRVTPLSRIAPGPLVILELLRRIEDRRSSRARGLQQGLGLGQIDPHTCYPCYES